MLPARPIFMKSDRPTIKIPTFYTEILDIRPSAKLQDVSTYIKLLCVKFERKRAKKSMVWPIKMNNLQTNLLTPVEYIDPILTKNGTDSL